MMSTPRDEIIGSRRALYRRLWVLEHAPVPAEEPDCNLQEIAELEKQIEALEGVLR